MVMPPCGMQSLCMEKNFWRNRQVLVTGAGGFVGSHLKERLDELGANTMTVIRAQNGVDVTRREMLEPLFVKKPSLVIHLAGEAIVEKGQEHPYETFRTNVMGSLNVLELSRIHHISRIIVASTAHVYGLGQPPFTEKDPPRPSRPYETSKTAMDILAQSYADSFHLPVVIPRFVNIYGPGDVNVSRLIPKTIHYVLRGESVPLWGGMVKREYLYIDDAIDAYMLLATMPEDRLEKNRIFNFGTGGPVTVTELIRRIGKLSGQPIRIKRVNKGREGEIPEQYVSWEKARRVLGWRPRVSLDEGLGRTIAWWREHP